MVDSDRSPLWSLAATGALATGIGFGYTKNKLAFNQAVGNLAQFARGATDDIIGQSLKNTSANRFALGRIISNAPVNEQLGYSIANLSGSLNNIKTNLHMAAYESVMSSGGVSSKAALAKLNPILEQTSSFDAFKAASSAISDLGGNTSLFESRVRAAEATGVYSSDLLSKSVRSEGGMGRILPKDVMLSDLPEEAKSRFLAIQENLSGAAGGKFSISGKAKLISDIVEGEKITTPMGVFNVGGQQINIPLSNQARFTYGGANTSTRYIPRQAYTGGGANLSFSEMYERSVVDALQTSKYNTELKNRIYEINQNVIDTMRDRDATARAAAVWSMPEPAMPSGGRARARLMAQQAIAFGATPEEIESLVGQGKLFAHTSPNAAGKGTLFSSNMSEKLFGPLGSLISAEQRPTQFIRSEWGATALSKQSAQPFSNTFGQFYNRVDRKIKGPEYEKLLYGGANALSGEAYSAPQLMTFYAKPSISGYGLGYESSALNNILAQEEGVVSQSAQNMFEYERTVQKKISLESGLAVDEELLSALKGKRRGEYVGFKSPVEGARFLGVEAGTGKQVITGAERAGFRQAAIGAELTGVNEATVYIRERRKLQNNELWKFFSEENKFMLGLRNDKEFKNIAKAAGLKNTTLAGQRIESIMSGKLVQRNKFASITQQIEAASAILSNQVDTGARLMNNDIAAFLSDPAKALNVSAIMQSGAANADVQIQRNLIGLTKKYRFTPEQMGLTFGLTKSIDPFRDLLTRRDISAIRNAPGVIGLSKGRLGDLASGSWGRGSFEQSGFRLLAMKDAAYADELSRRLVGTGNLGAVDKLAASVLGQQPLLDKFKRGELESLSDISAKNLVQNEGRYISLGRGFAELGGSKELYIPGLQEAESIVGSVQSGGKLIDSPFVKELKSFRRLMRKGASDEELEIAAKGLRNITMSQVESQFAARGKVIGSQILTGMRRTFSENSDVFRISRESASRMFDDLIERANPSQAKFLAQQRESALAGNIMHGGMWRHPTTGPESFQFVKYMVDKDLAEGMIAAPSRFGQIQFAGKEAVTADISEMVGFAGDFDRDQYVLASIAERDTLARIEKQMGGAIQSQYNNYVFNHYGMKNLIDNSISKSEVLGMNSAAALKSGYRKLTTAKTTTGQVNLALQRLKLGVQYAAPEKYRPMADLFFHLEQAAIGGKHGTLDSELYQAIAESTKGGKEGKELLRQAITSIFGGENINISGSFTDAAGNISQHNFNLQAQEAADVAISSYESVKNEIDVAMRSSSLGKGKRVANARLSELIEQFHMRRAGGVDVAQAFMQNQATGDMFTQRATRAIRQGETKVKGFLNVVKKAKAPLLMGAAAAAGIMLMAPGTAGVLRMPEGPAGGANVTPEDIGPPGGPGLNPPPPRQNIAPRVYDIGSGRETNYANIRMRVDDLDSNSRDFMSSVRSFGGNTRIQTSDDRSVLDPRLLAKKIHERL
jgi:hypothetical protein